MILKLKNTIYLILEYCNQGDLSKYILSKSNIYDTQYIYQLLWFYNIYIQNLIYEI